MKYENLIGKPFVLGKQDCFTMVIDFFDQNFGIKIPSFARPSNWKSDDLDLIGMLHSKAGFERIDVENWKPRPGDILATAVGSGKPNHLVIYVGDNELIHHKMNALSTHEPYRPAWRTFTCYILRHPDVPDMEVDLPDVTIEELLRARYSLQV